jgi:EAL domain-containing protein (putative c-di-GMP-specific phosphodiesterase class I)
LRELKSLGVTLAIDDFGTGYSCLSSLKNLPIHRVKIDRAFVRDVPQDLNDVAITEAIIAMAHRLHLQVVAEGVETIEQEELLRSRGCDEVQGYLYAKPLPADELVKLINNRNRAAH